MNSPLHSAANMLSRRRRNAMSVSNSLASDMREGLQMLSASMFPSLTLPPPVAASVPALSSSAAFNEMGSSAQQTRDRLRQRRNALVNINSRALRLALNLPLSPQASPLTSPQRRFVFGRNENNAVPAPQDNSNDVQDSSFSLDGIPCAADEPVIMSAPRSPAPPPRARSNLRRRAAICFQTPAQLFASAEQPNGVSDEKEDGAAVGSFLSVIEPVSVAASPSPSPLAMVFGSPVSASSTASVSASPPLPSFPPRLSPPMFSRRPSTATGMVPRVNRRRGAVIAHADFMQEIPEEWVQMQQQHQEEGHEEERVSQHSSPRIRRMIESMQPISLDDSSFDVGSVEGSPFFSPLDASDNSVTPVDIRRRASLPSISFSSVGAIFGGLVGSPDSAEISQYAGSHWSTSAGVPELLGAEVVDGRDDCVLMLGYVAAEHDYRMEEPGVDDQKESEYSVSQPGGGMMATQINYSSAYAAHVQR